MSDTLIKNGLVVTSESTFQGDVLLSGETIAALGPGLSAPAGAEVIDASGLLVVPGGVDAHTHLDLTVGEAHVSDGWFKGTLAAAYGGVTSIVEHPGFGPDGCSIFHQLNSYRQNAEKAAVVDYGLHGVFQHWNEQIALELPKAVAEGYSSFKAYMTYGGRLSDDEFLLALKHFGQAGGLMTVHAENHSIVTYLGGQLKLTAPHSPASHPASRPGYAEALAIHTAVCLARAAGNVPLYIVHLSTAAGLEIIKAAKKEGLQVWAETCPQYLYLTGECYEKPFDEALKYVMAPVPRRQEDVEALWGGLLDGSIDVVATDHCSFSWADKKNRSGGNIFKSPGGIPGIETRGPLLYSEGVLKRGLSLPRWVTLAATAPARLFGLKNKGDLKVGYDADVVIFDPEKQKCLSADILHQAVDYTPFENMTVTGWPIKVFLRGRKIIDGEFFTGEEGQGRFLRREPFSG